MNILFVDKEVSESLILQRNQQFDLLSNNWRKVDAFTQLSAAVTTKYKPVKSLR